jgi:serine/threonine protein kinase
VKIGDNIIANYHIKSFLGKGGMGEVMLAEDNGFYGKVAIKTIRIMQIRFVAKLFLG